MLHEKELSSDNYHLATCVHVSLYKEEGQPKVKLRSMYLVFDKKVASGLPLPYSKFSFVFNVIMVPTTKSHLLYEQQFFT